VTSTLPAPARDFLKAALIAAAVLAIYFPAIHGDWVWDDTTLILQNHFIHDPAGLAAIWSKPINGTEFLPLTSTAEWIEWHLFGANTLGYHLISLLLHAASALLVWRLLAKLGVECAWLGGLLFAIHPLAVESVAWISELKNTLSLPPFLLAMCAWIDFDRSEKRRDYYLALGWFIVSMLAKPTAMMFPATILLYAWWRHLPISAKGLLQSAPFIAISLAFGLLATILARTGADPSTLTAGVWSRLATAGWQMWILLGKCLLPIHLLPLYPSGLVTSPSPLNLLPWVLMLALIAMLWLKRDTWGRHALLGLGFYLLNLIPALGFIAMNATTMVWSLDHLVYLPLIGIVGLAVAAGSALPNRLWISSVAAMVLVLLAGRTMLYSTVFADGRALWTAVIAGNPKSSLAHNNLGHWYLNKGKYPEAIAEYRAAIALKSDYPFAHNGLGNALAMQADAKNAAAEYREALVEIPGYAEAHNGLANVLRVMGKFDDARAEADLALKLKPNYLEAICTLGLIDAQQGKTADAIQQFESALKLAPNNPQIVQALEELRAKR
jgi:tetratricopeptide (TPR) repeat protein